MRRLAVLLAAVIASTTSSPPSVAAQPLPTCGTPEETRLTSFPRLADWPELPAALAATPDAQRLGAEARCQDWVLFTAGYRDRLPDWLAMNISTGEVRRFVDVARSVVEDDLLGLRAAPAYATDLARWGNPEARELARRFDIVRTLVDPRDYFAELQEATLPIYALAIVNPPFGLRVKSVQGGRGPNQIASLEYVNDDQSVSLTLTTTDWLYGRDIQQASTSQTPGTRGTVYDQLRGDLSAQADATRAFSPHHFTLDGRDFDGGVFVSEDDPTHPTFVFRTPELTLSGTAPGLTESDVMGVLAQVVPLNAHPEIVDAMRAAAAAQRPKPAAPRQLVTTVAQQPAEALATYASVRPLIEARYPDVLFTGIVAQADNLSPDGTSRLWAFQVWGPLSAADTTRITAPLSTPEPAQSASLSISSQNAVQVTLLGDASDARWTGAYASVVQSTSVDVAYIARLADAGPVSTLLDSRDAVRLADQAGGAAFRQQTGGTLVRIALGTQTDHAAPRPATQQPTPARPVWGLRYQSANGATSWLAILDAHTGAMLFADVPPED